MVEKESNIIKIDKNKVASVLQLIEKSHDQFDHKTVPWRKRYEPFFMDLKNYFVE